MKTACIIQARRGSSRLRDKILKPLVGKTVLEHVIERAKLINGVDLVICATVDNNENKPVMAIAEKAGAIAFAGSEHDVLDRYYQAAKHYHADIIIRITADCPLLDPYLCSMALDLVKSGQAEYGSTPGQFPHGMDCEVFSFLWLKKAHESATLPEDREHVTLWMKAQSSIKKQTIKSPPTSFRSQNRWVVDYPEDYEFMTQLASVAPNGILPQKWQTTLALIDEHPHLRKINQNRTADWALANKKIFELAKEQR